jgi:hypothetical protein
LTLTAAPFFIAAACGRLGYDRLPVGVDGSAPLGSGGSNGSLAGSAGAGGRTAQGGSGGFPDGGSGGGTFGQGGSFAGSGGGAGGTSAGGSPGTGIGGSPGQGGGFADASQPDTADDLTAPNDTAGPPATCTQAGSPIRVWSFATSVEGWELSGTGTMVWTGAIGDPAPGAIQVDCGGQVVHPRLVQALGDLRGRILTAELWLDSGVNVSVKLFVQTGSRLVWADGGLVTPTPGQWTCLALDIDNPFFSRQQYDPTDIQIVGLEVSAMGTSRVYIDEVAY